SAKRRTASMSIYDNGDNGDLPSPRPPVGKPVPSDPDFYLKWADENAKEFAKVANTALGQLLTLSTALFGGSIAFWKNIPLVDPAKYLMISLLLLTVLVCLVSAMPTQGSVSSTPSDIRESMKALFKR